MRTGTLDNIQAQFSDPKCQLLEMLKTWLTTSYRRRVVRVVVLLLLLISGDIETNPGPVGKCTSLTYCKHQVLDTIIH